MHQKQPPANVARRAVPAGVVASDFTPPFTVEAGVADVPAESGDPEATGVSRA